MTNKDTGEKCEVCDLSESLCSLLQDVVFENAYTKRKELAIEFRRNITTLRHTWLHQEIEVLEGMKKSPFEDNTPTPFEVKGYNEALQTIIDRYKEELNQK